LLDRDAGVSDAHGYRPDIDGLRALAVLSVIAFHAWPTVLRGGFLGVDVFFVISGYLITGIAVAERQAGQFSLAAFYERRARRLLPALVAMLASTQLVALLLLQPQEVAALSRSVMAATTWLSNIYFWRNTGYFGEVASAQPLLHTWSLAVEEQFYLLFPLLLLIALARSSRPRHRLVLVLTCGCAALSLWASIKHPSANFFVLPFRAWELLAGASLAFWHTRERKAQESSGRNVAWSLFGLTAVIAGIACADETRDGLFTFGLTSATVLGSVALLHSGRDGTTPAARLLSMRPLVLTGLISYSLYLWHLPVLTLARLHLGELRAQALLPALLALTGLLSWLSYRWIEQRWRRSRPSTPRRHFVVGITACTAVLFGLATALHLNEGSALPLTSGERTLLRMSYDYAEDYRLGTCFLSDHQLPEAFEDCSVPGTAHGSPTALLWGDSYAAHLWPGLVNETAWYASLQQRTITGCAPLLEDERAPAFCVRSRRSVLDEIRRRPPGHVVLSARWTAVHPAPLQRTIAALHAAGVTRVSVLGPTPRWRGGLPGWLQGAADGMGKLPEQLEPWNTLEQAWINQAIRAAAEGAGARYVDMLAGACPEWPRCLAVSPPPGQALLYWDEGHLTRAGASLLMRNVAPQLRVDPSPLAR
jgi:peptidoglycan/LPS O-acetylase OafA/YrhL